MGSVQRRVKFWNIIPDHVSHAGEPEAFMSSIQGLMGSQSEKKGHRNKASPQKNEKSVKYERIHLWEPPLSSHR